MNSTDDLEQIRRTVTDAVHSALEQLLPRHQWLTTTQACKMLNFSPVTLKRRVADGTFVRLYHYTGDGIDRRWHSGHLDRWLVVRDEPTQQARDLAKWQKTLKK